jgi:hypothetical protein
MRQTVISRVENPDYGDLTVNALKRIAKALDVGLTVRFCALSEIVDWSLAPSQEVLTVPSFDEEMRTPERRVSIVKRKGKAAR